MVWLRVSRTPGSHRPPPYTAGAENEDCKLTGSHVRRRKKKNGAKGTGRPGNAGSVGKCRRAGEPRSPICYTRLKKVEKEWRVKKNCTKSSKKKQDWKKIEGKGEAKVVDWGGGKGERHPIIHPFYACQKQGRTRTKNRKKAYQGRAQQTRDGHDQEPHTN